MQTRQEILIALKISLQFTNKLCENGISQLLDDNSQCIFKKYIQKKLKDKRKVGGKPPRLTVEELRKGRNPLSSSFASLCYDVKANFTKYIP